MENEGKLRLEKRKQKVKEKPGWKIRLQSSIEAIRRKISYTYVLIECNCTQKLTSHQKAIKREMEKQYGKTSTENLKYVRTMLKQDLKVQSEKLKRRNTIQERRYINRMFRIAPKTVYRTMKGENKGPVKDMPDQSKVEEFWGGLWGTQTQYNKNAPWLHTLERDYVPNAQQKEYEITEEIFDKVISKMANNKPAKDLTTCMWIKDLRSTKHLLRENLKDITKRQAEMPEWLITTKTILITKNKETKNEQNYHPIAIQNTMYKIYTGILAEFIMDHCKMNDVITEEQAVGKRGSWGCTDQLLANKMIYNQN